MTQTRRHFLSRAAGAAATATLIPTNMLADQGERSGPRNSLARHIVEEFQKLPGTKSLAMLSPSSRGANHFAVELNPTAMLFCGSAFKIFILAEFLRDVEAGTASLTELLPVNESIWSIDAPVLTPWPGAVSGQVNALTAIDAMISRSDNTATDMLLKRVGPQRVREFISSIGMQSVRIPDSTRQFIGYIAGAANWQTITFREAMQAVADDDAQTRPILNDVQTMAASARDFVSFYSRALQNEFFNQPATQTPFRMALSHSEAIPRAFPLGVNGFIKGGSIDFDGHHALAVPGGVFIPPKRWVYFAFMVNWTDAQTGGRPVADVTAQFGATLLQIFTSLRDDFGCNGDK